VAEPRVLAITGANGFIGSRLVQRFVANGWAVRALVRRVPESGVAGVEYREWQLGDAARPDLLAGTDCLIHCAFAPYDRPDASELNIGGSMRLLEAARGAGVGRIIFLSSISARAGAPSQYGRDKFVIQALFDRLGELVIRPGLVLGHGGLFERISRFVSRRRVVPLVGGGQRFQTVHVDDLAAAIDIGIERRLSGVVTVAEPRPVAFGELLREAARQMGTRVSFVPVPYGAVALTMRVARVAHIRLPVSSDNLAGLRAVQPEDVADDLRLLGVTVRDYRASLRALLADDTRGG
jgi:nucleoside-diphosphate-sugar epimerase